MTMLLRIDSDALATLFPEGSQARVDLQAAVVANFVKKLAIKDVKLLDEQLLAEAKSVIRTEFAALGVREFYKDVKLTGNMTEAIRKQVNAVVVGELNNAAAKAVEEHADVIPSAVIERIDQLLAAEARDRLMDMIRRAVREVINITIK